jgi:hypothetical protein
MVSKAKNKSTRSPCTNPTPLSRASGGHKKVCIMMVNNFIKSKYLVILMTLHILTGCNFNTYSNNETDNTSLDSCKKIVTVYFLEGFSKDEIMFLFNDSLVFNKVLSTDESIGCALMIRLPSINTRNNVLIRLKNSDSNFRHNFESSYLGIRKIGNHFSYFEYSNPLLLD